MEFDADRYEGGFQRRFSGSFHALLADQAALWPGASVLDIGCGPGLLLARLQDRCAIQGHGVDINQGMLAAARRRCPQMEFASASSDALPFADDAFDLVTVSLAYHHFQDQAGFAREARRVLKADGRLMIAEPRWPAPLRGLLNAAFRRRGVIARFDGPVRIATDLMAAGFQPVRRRTRGLAQVYLLVPRP
ncbi:MAG: methyltransferase domain-containing protein [Propionibacteriaceae bacterium]|jgi:demethylmenaquinone methyltransferase/2-methoxy-6-polyprenyl-1,4-benzoquinol methylase|nr:methyltransferase domain-containing protein [Propionibacteriaceae bacterium]